MGKILHYKSASKYENAFSMYGVEDEGSHDIN